jgi:hypothetical protein
MATHEDEHLERILEVFERVGRELGLLTPEARERIAAGMQANRTGEDILTDRR